MSRALLWTGFIFFICVFIGIIGMAIYAGAEQDKMDQLKEFYGVNSAAGEELYLCDDGTYEVHNPAVPPLVFCGEILREKGVDDDEFDIDLGVS